MFKHVEINLTGPICDCDEMDLAWGIRRDDSGQSCLAVSCKTCGTQLVVSNSKFRAGFSLDKPYPGRKKNVVPLKLLDGGQADPKDSEGGKK